MPSGGPSGAVGAGHGAQAVSVLELFAGAGGASEGLAALGLEHVGVELDPVAAGTAVAAGHKRVVADVAAMDPRDFADVTGLWSSPPCVSFSSAGSGAGRQVMDVLADGITRTIAGERVVDRVREECTRVLEVHALTDPKLAKLTPVERSEWAVRQATVSALVVEVARYARDLRPEWVACEQVPGVLPLWRVLARALRGAGYRAWCGVLCAADYGVPQTRRRAILVASRIPAHRVGPPEPTHAEHPGEGDLFGPALPGWVSMAAALGPDWPDRAPWAVTGGANGAVFGGAQPRRVVAAYRRTRGEGVTDRHGDRPDTPANGPAPTVTGKARSDTWVLRNNNTANAAVRALDEPAPTLFWGGRCNAVDWAQTRPATTVQGDLRIAPPDHRDREGGEPQFGPATVRVSVAEAACLQGFRADFPWRGTRSSRFQQVGNAVPPPLTAAVVGHLLDVDWRPLVAAYLARTALAPDREVA